VETYIQSGNVVFRAPAGKAKIYESKISQSILQTLGLSVATIIRTFEELEKIIAENPFEKITEPNVKFYTFFLASKPARTHELPIISEKTGIELFSIIECDAFVISRQVKGIYGFPNNFIEKELGVSATARNMNTVCSIIEKYAGRC
jgi:uncharacterized protein (DUF1697 family)